MIFFNPALAAGFERRRKRAGQLWSKMRYLSAQLEAYLADGLWLRNAAHANAMATRLARGLAGRSGVTLLHAVQANELFLAMPEERIEALQAAGAQFYRWIDVPGVPGRSSGWSPVPDNRGGGGCVPVDDRLRRERGLKAGR